MENKRPRISPENAARIEKARGDVPFDRWVNRLIEAYFADDEWKPGEPVGKREQALDVLDETSAMAAIRRRPRPNID